MRKRGFVISASYALILLVLLLPVFLLLAQSQYSGLPQFLRDLAEAYVRRRHECSTPAVTSFGIVTGVAILLVSFAPSVLLLYKKCLDT